MANSNIKIKKQERQLKNKNVPIKKIKKKGNTR